MVGRLRFVLDTNVFIDAICFRTSFGRRAYNLVTETSEVVVSLEIFAELEAVLRRPKFERFLTIDERMAALSAIRQETTPAEPWCNYRICRDPSDDKFIDLAVCTGASSIITRDVDLLTLGPINGITVLDPKSFVLENYRSN